MKHAAPTPCPDCKRCANWESRFGVSRCTADKPVIFVGGTGRECADFEEEAEPDEPRRD